MVLLFFFFTENLRKLYLFIVTPPEVFSSETAVNSCIFFTDHIDASKKISGESVESSLNHNRGQWSKSDFFREKGVSIEHEQQKVQSLYKLQTLPVRPE